MKLKYMMNPLISNKWRAVDMACSVLAGSVLLSACGGGGGGVPEVPEAVVLSVANTAAVLEGNQNPTQPTQLKFLVTLSKPAVRGVDVFYTTASTAKTGVFSNSTGSAIGSTSLCLATGAKDYVSVSAKKLSIKAGDTTDYLVVDVCPDAIFQPNKTLKMKWSSAGSAEVTAIGTIINDDPGGLNGAGAATVMGGVTAFGRDTQSLTNSDADGAKGFSFAKRQSDVSWNCTYDNVTGLSWLRPWGLGQYSGNAAAVNAANNASSCGATDWRVPTVNELLSLMDVSRAAAYGAVNADREGVVDLPMNNKFWTSEVLKPAPTIDAWIVDSINGGAVSVIRQTSTAGLRLVSGQPLENGNSSATVCNESDRYKDFGDQTVEDTKTGLMWRQYREGATEASYNTISSSTFESGAKIVAYVSSVNANPNVFGLGYSDWRIPTVKELSSLVDRRSNNPAIYATCFPNNPPMSFVTASVDANSSDRFWSVNFNDGGISVDTPWNKYLRLVRAGH